MYRAAVWSAKGSACTPRNASNPVAVTATTANLALRGVHAEPLADQTAARYIVPRSR